MMLPDQCPYAVGDTVYHVTEAHDVRYKHNGNIMSGNYNIGYNEKGKVMGDTFVEEHKEDHILVKMTSQRAVNFACGVDGCTSHTIECDCDLSHLDTEVGADGVARLRIVTIIEAIQLPRYKTLSKFSGAFEDEGYEDWEEAKILSDGELRELGLKKDTLKSFVAWSKNLKLI
eukprot:TRINITY_DN952_c0_g1_i1.p1 TRINITY_DN952_c0_g1~~TRINITY_DN952_c0_g1_i1.p1  ORF type:complete len:190 (-),score=25.40 TRINITY_DN952_c0_g1_i1:392-910(-)